MRTNVMSKTYWCAAALVAAAGSVHAAWGPSDLKVFQPGLTDAEHTLGDGTHYDYLANMNASGRVTGNTARYNNTADLVFGADSLSAWTWTYGNGTVRLGLTDAEHTSAGDVKYSLVQVLNDAGVAAGVSYRYDGASQNGQSAWMWSEGSGTVRIGFTDATHTGAGNTQLSSLRGINASSQIVGYSHSYDAGGNQAGQTGWAWTAGNGLTALGLTDGEHTRTDGIRTSEVAEQNNTNRVIGNSYRYSGMSVDGRSAWTWTQADGHTRMGLTDADHTDGTTQMSVAQFVNESGLASGFSDRYTGVTDPFNLGRSAWAWSNGMGTQRIGLTDGAHTDANGLQFSAAGVIIGGDQIIGQSRRYSGTTQNGESAWVWTASSGTTRVGLTDSEHTSNSTGEQSSTVNGNSGSTYVIGNSTRFDVSGVDSGRSAWVWSSGTGTTQIGLSGGNFENSSGFRVNNPIDVNASGDVVGTTSRFNGVANAGQAIWTWSPDTGTTTRIGLFTAPHSAGNLTQQSDYLAMNDAGQILGTSVRYLASNPRGQSGWFYDPGTNTTYPLIFSTGTGNSGRTVPTILTDTGLVMGNYNVYSGSSVLSTNAFLWSVDNGFVDLGQFIDGMLSDYGWAQLNSVLDANELEAIVGYGRLSDMLGGAAGGQSVYVLVVPSPSGVGLLSVAGLMAWSRRRR